MTEIDIVKEELYKVETNQEWIRKIIEWKFGKDINQLIYEYQEIKDKEEGETNGRKQKPKQQED